MTENEPDPHILKQKKKRRRIILAVLLLVFLALGLFVMALVRLYTGESVISVDYVAQWQRISKPADYDPNQDAFFDYQKAIETVTRAPYAISFAPPTLWPGDMNDAQMQILRKWLEENTDAINHLKRGSIKPYCWMQDTYTDNLMASLPPGLDWSGIRELMWPITSQAKLDAAQGRTDDAIENLLVGYRYSSHMMDSKPMMYQLVGSAIRGMLIHRTFLVLDRAKIKSEKLRYFQEQLQQLLDTKNSDLDFHYERLAILDVIQRVFTDDGKDNGHLIPNDDAVRMVREYLSWEEKHSPRSDGFLSDIFDFDNKPTEQDARTKSVRIALFGPDRKQTMEMAEKVFDYYESLKDKSFWQMRNDNAEETLNAMSKNCVVLSWHLNNYRILEIYQRLRATQNALIATLGILRYKQDKGSLPENLQQLVDTGYLIELPMDPFCTGNLGYKVTGQDFVLYSFAYDCDDDGGDQVFWPIKRWDGND